MKLRPNDPCRCGSGKKYKRCCGPRDRVARLQRSQQPAQAPTVHPGTIGPAGEVPPEIPRPEYVGGKRPGRSGQLIKPPEAIAGMRRSCALARQVLDETCAAAKAGMTTDSLDAIAHAATVAAGAYPSPLDYHGYRKSICTSVNEVICHGIPDDRELADGDIVNIDVTVYFQGFHGDCSRTVLIGDVAPRTRELVSTTYECLMKGIKAAQPGGKLNEVGRAIEAHATAHGFSVVRAFVGHGIGETFHMDPQVQHYYDPGERFVLKPGMTLTIEPMINMGDWTHRLWDDGWTAVTTDLLPSAQFEHTILMTDHGAEILTAGADEAAS